MIVNSLECRMVGATARRDGRWGRRRRNQGQRWRSLRQIVTLGDESPEKIRSFHNWYPRPCQV